MPFRKPYRSRRFRPRRRAGRNPRKMFRYGKRLGNLNKSYAYKRIANTLIMQNGNTLGGISTNDTTQLSLGTPVADTIGYQFGASMSFSLQNLQTVSDFTNLYDQYKITGVKLTFIPTSSEATVNSSGYLPTMYWATDNDDSSPPSETEIRQKNNVKMRRLNNPMSVYVKYPKCVIDTQLTGGTNLALMTKTGWINCTNTQVQHNGLKLFFKNFDLRAQPNYINALRIEATYYVKFRAVQ